MSSKLKRLILIDGNALVYRAYHALPPLTTKTGELVNAVYGFTTLLLKAIQDLDPDYIAVAFDIGKTFRHTEYKEYKATRAKMPDDLFGQLGRVREVVAALNIPIFTAEGYEADDVIGTLSNMAAKKNIETMIVTGDRDSFQLASQLVKIYTMRSNSYTDTTIYDAETVEKRYGVTPEQFVDFKALVGDNSDNIPGVKGIGEKSATALLQAFGSLDALYDFLEHKDLSEAPMKITPRVKELLLSEKETAYKSQYLSRIVRDIPMELDLEAAALKNYDRKKAVDLFQELEFRTLVAKLPESHDNSGDGWEEAVKSLQPESQAKTGGTKQSSLFAAAEEKVVASKIEGKVYHLVQDEETFEKLLVQLKKAKAFVVDTETDFLNGPVIGFSFAVKAGEAWYVPVGTVAKPTNCIGKLSRADVLAQLKPILEDESIAKAGHNMKYDYLAIQKEGIIVKPLAFDTMIASYLLNPASRQHGLDAVAFSEFGVEKIPLAELIGVKKLDSLADVPVEKVAEYAAEDADVTYRLYELYEPRLKEDHLKKVFYDIEMPLVPVLAMMESIGIKVDCDYLGDLSKRLTKRQNELIEEIYDHAGQEFNINSTQQLATILFDKLQLNHPDIKKTKTGVSTAASELEKLRGMHPIIDLIFEYRELTKLLSTYINTLPDQADEKLRIHTSYSQTTAATGRLASNDPNLQNIPIRTELGREIRKAFVTEKGMQLVSVDYSQIELRVVAHMAGDVALAKAFKENRDIHQEVADALGVDRRVGKTLNFAVLYGQGPYSTAGQLGIPMAQAREYIDRYFKTYAGVRRFLDETLKRAKEKGYVETIFGRRRYLPEIKSSNFTVRGAAERMATNMPVQGTAADLMKIAMINIANSGVLERFKANMLLQVHDELVFEVDEEQAQDFSKEIKELMQNVAKLSVPLLAEVKIGANWGEMTHVDL